MIEVAAASEPAREPPVREEVDGCKLHVDDFSRADQSWSLLTRDGATSWGWLNAGASGEASLTIGGEGPLAYDYTGSGVTLEGLLDRDSAKLFAGAPLHLSPVATLRPDVALPWTELDDGDLLVEVDLGDDFEPRRLEARVRCRGVALHPSDDIRVDGDLSDDDRATTMELDGAEPLSLYESPTAPAPSLSWVDVAGVSVLVGDARVGRRLVQYDTGAVVVRGWVAADRVVEPAGGLGLAGAGQAGGILDVGLARRGRRDLRCDRALPLYVLRGDDRFLIGSLHADQPLHTYGDEATDGPLRVVHLGRAPLSLRPGWTLAATQESLAACGELDP